MESLERTPTPREMLFALQQRLHTIISNEYEFYSELSKKIGEEEIAVDDTDNLVKAAEIYNQDYIATTRDEEGEIVGEVSLLGILKNKFVELESKIIAALDNKDNFGDLINLLETEQRLIHDDDLFKSLLENGDTDLEGDIDILTDWYNDMLTQAIKYIDRIYNEPELKLT